MQQIKLYKKLDKYIPRNAFYNLKPVNQVMVLGGIKPKRGRPATMMDFGNSVLNNPIFQAMLEKMLKPLNIFEIVSINAVLGTSRYKVTPTNAWRRFLLGNSAVRVGRPTQNTRIANTALRMMGAPDPKTAAISAVWYMVGLTIAWYFRPIPKEPEVTIPVVDDEPEDESILVTRAAAREINEASLSVLVMCDHDDCPEQAFVLKTELADYVQVDLQTDHLVWHCNRTHAIQRCKIIDLQTANLRIHVDYRM